MRKALLDFDLICDLSLIWNFSIAQINAAIDVPQAQRAFN